MNHPGSTHRPPIVATPEGGTAQALEPLLDFYDFLVQASGLVVRARDIESLYTDICELAIRLDRRLVLAWVGIVVPGSQEVSIAASAGAATDYLDHIQVLRVDADAHGRGPTGRAVREGCCIIANRFLDDPTTAPWHAKAREFGIAASATIPLRRAGQVCGALMLYANQTDIFNERIAAALETLSKTLSHAIDSATEREQRLLLESELLASQKTMRAILDSTHQTILMMTPEGRILAVNQKGAERLGTSPAQLIGRDMFAMMPPAVSELRRRQVEAALRSGKPLVMEDQRDRFFFRSTINPVPGNPPSIVIYAEDISERVAAERAAQIAERRLTDVVNLATEGILTLDLDGNITFANPRVHAMLGIAPNQLVGQAALNFLHEDDRPDFLARLARVNQGISQGPLQVRYRLRSANGEVFHTQISAALKASVEGREEGLVVVITDISELQRAQNALAENEQRLAIALAGAAETIWQWNLDSGEAYWSPEFYRQLGYADREFPSDGEQWFAHMHPDDRQKTQDALARQLKAGQEILDVTYRFRTKSGEYRWIRGRGKVVSVAADGHPVNLTGTNVDVTAQQLQEQRNLRQAQRWIALLRLAQAREFDNENGEHEFLTTAIEEAQRLTGSRIGFLHFLNEAQSGVDLVTWTSTALEDGGIGLDRHYPIGQAGIWAESFRERKGLIINDYCAVQGVAEGRSPIAADPCVRRLVTVPVLESDKVCVIAWVGNKEEPYDQDDLEFLQLLATDSWRIVRRRRTEAALRNALRVVEASPVVAFRWRAEPGWPVIYVSENVNRWGYRAADLQAGRPPFSDLVHPEDMARVGEEVARYTAAGRSDYTQEYRLRKADGSYFWITDATRVIRDEKGVARFYEGVVRDIDADKRHQQELASSLEAQRALNKKLEAVQTQLLQSEKMASIGQLAAGVAHELNNPIGFVNSNMGTLGVYVRDMFEIIDAAEAAANQSAHPEDFASIRAARAARDFDYLRQDLLQLLDESRDGLDRVRKIVQDLKDFSRVGEVEWQWADINRGLESTLNIVWNELKYKCTVTKHFGTLPQIHCLPSQLNQVFMNLLVNAAQAIEKDGEIIITTERAGADAVRVRIADNGRGIPAENLNRIFDPFFTTKPVGKGTGLGLSVSWGIVNRHHGKIEVDSQVGRGSTFTITLPIEPPTE